MKNTHLFCDALHSQRSHSKLNSEQQSVAQDHDTGFQGLEKSLGFRKTTKDNAFHLSMEIEPTKDALHNLRPPISPANADRPSYLRRFAQRFDALRRSAHDDDFLNSSIQLPGAFRFDAGLNFGNPELLPLQELKSNSSTNNFLCDKENSGLSENSRSPSNKQRGSPPLQLIVPESYKAKTLETRERSSGGPHSPDFCARLAMEGRLTSEAFRLIAAKDGPSAPLEHPSMQRLYEVFVHIFEKGYLEPEDYALEKSEEEVLNCLLQRKFFLRLSQTELDGPLQAKLDRINEIVRGRSNKRPEECYKFVLTRANKSLKRRVLASKEISEDSDKLFYEYYFAELTQSLGLPIEQFIYPITRKQIEVAKLNSAYFERIFKSPKFLKDLQWYLGNAIFEEYKEELKKKLRSFLGKYDIMLHKPNCDTDAIEKKLKEYLLKNKRCKLPWTLNEIKESIVRFQILIESLKSKQHL